MIDLLFIAMFQSVAGQPAEAPATPAPEVVESEAAAPAEAQTQASERPQEVRTCENRQVIGSRQTRRVCTTRAQARDLRQHSRETVEHIQRLPAPLQGE